MQELCAQHVRAPHKSPDVGPHTVVQCMIGFRAELVVMSCHVTSCYVLAWHFTSCPVVLCHMKARTLNFTAGLIAKGGPFQDMQGWPLKSTPFLGFFFSSSASIGLRETGH